LRQLRRKDLNLEWQLKLCVAQGHELHVKSFVLSLGGVDEDEGLIAHARASNVWLAVFPKLLPNLFDEVKAIDRTETV